MLDQQVLFPDACISIAPFKLQLLKWIGNKQRFAHEIAGHFPQDFNRYFEPFLGSGAVLATLASQRAFGSDAFKPLIEIWKTLRTDPDHLKEWYRTRWELAHQGDKVEAYEQIKQSFNNEPNGADLLFLCRSCYGGVVRFRQADGFMSTPCGPHKPIHPDSFAKRVDIWHRRTSGAQFDHMGYEESMSRARSGDVVYCDPPYTHTQKILYGAQAFSLGNLFDVIDKCKSRGAKVVLSIDGTKKSGDTLCDLPIPDGLFEREIFVNVGRSMLKRFQMNGRSLENEVVADRMLLTY